MSGLCGRTITDFWHKVQSLEASSDSVINTLRFSPVGLKINTVDLAWEKTTH